MSDKSTFEKQRERRVMTKDDQIRRLMAQRGRHQHAEEAKAIAKAMENWEKARLRQDFAWEIK